MFFAFQNPFKTLFISLYHYRFFRCVRL